MYSKPSPRVTATTAANTWPLVAICCLGLIGFVIASTIVLALIPVYLPTKQVTLSTTNSDEVYVRYLSSGDGSTSLTGTVTDSQSLSELQQRINQGMPSSNEGITIDSGSSQTSFSRRRRSLGYHRDRRDISTAAVFKCKYKYRRSCRSKACRSSAKTRINNVILQTKTLSNVLFIIKNKQFGSRSLRVTLMSPEIFTEMPSGLDVEPSTFGQFVAVKSGQFTDSSTWLDGVIPYGNSTIIIPTAISITLNKNLVDLYIVACEVNGTFTIGSTSSSNIKFAYPLNLIVYPTGNLVDNTNGHVFDLIERSIVTVYPGGTFTGKDTMITTATSSSSKENRRIQFRSGKGPRTCGNLPGGGQLAFEKVTCIVSASAEFTSSMTWLGGRTPTIASCILANGCGMSIYTGFTLSTASLYGQLNMNFDLIEIAADSELQLGTPGDENGFTFKYRLIIQCYGRIRDVTGKKGGIKVPPRSVINFYPGSSFISSTTTSVKAYNPISGAMISSLTLDLTFPGPFYIVVSASGLITTSTTTPGDFMSIVPTIYTVIKSGDFNDPTVWSGGIVPSGRCSIVIPAGFTITFTGAILNIQIETLTIAGGFVIVSTTDFTFQYMINIIVQGTGSFEDRTTTHKLYFLPGSLCTFYAKASFIGSGTIVYKYATLPASGSLGASYTLGSSLTGPFTLGFLFNGEIQYFDSITFIVGVSGSFSLGATWLGGIAPTAEFCASIGGCGLYIPSGCVLSTESLNGELNINFAFITVAKGATFSLGSAGLSGGFRFKFKFNFKIFGTLKFLPTAGGKIYLPFGSVLNFYDGAKMDSMLTVNFQIYDVAVGGEGILLISMSSSFTGSFFASISLTGEITITSELATTPLTTDITALTSDGTGETATAFDVTNNIAIAG